MTLRTGSEYLKSLDDDRTVILDGEVVDDVLEHPAFARMARTIADLYDVASDPANGMQFESPDIGGAANRVLAPARSREELRLRREAVATWAQRTHGWVGRSPDHVGSFLACFGTHPEVFAHPDHDFAGNARRIFERVLQESLYVSYAIIPPQVSRAGTASTWGEDLLQVGVVEETEQGLVVRGSQMLATGAPLADEILVTCIKPLGPDDAQFAVSFVIPAATEGLKMYCRRPYAPSVTSEFDYPLTARFDEPDALLVFDDVLVPWDRVLINQDVAKCREQFFSTGAHALGNWQAQTRFMTKLGFIAGVAHKVCETNGVLKIPAVLEKLGELASVAASVESAVLAAEYTAEADEQGIFIPGKRALYGAMGLQAETYPKVLNLLRDLVGGGVLQLPSSVRDLESELTRDDIEKYVKSPSVPSAERIKLFRLAWDIVGSEFAGRHQQYEMFYAGAPFVVKSAYAYRNYDYGPAVREVDAFLSSIAAPARA